MNKIKKYQSFIFLFLVLFPGIITILLFFAFQGYMKSEIYTLTGLIDADHTDAVEVFQNYLSYNGADRVNAFNDGLNIVSLSGYEFSASDVLSFRLVTAFFPILVILFFTFSLFFISAMKLWKQECKEHRLWKEKCIQQERYIKNILLEKDQLRLNIDEYEGNLYHQLKTPITSLQLCLEQLQEAESDSHNTSYSFSSHENLWKSANIQIQKLSRLITLFLRDRQLSSKKIRFNYQISMLDTILLDAASQVMLQAEEKNIPFKFSLPNENWELACDEIWLQECFLTLLENAVEHSAENEAIQIQMKSVNGYYCIHITSHGKLLNPHQLEHIFERYYSSKTNHFGIGLHMAKSIVENHHGTIKAVNQPDDGSVRFSVILPALNKADIYKNENVTFL